MPWFLLRIELNQISDKVSRFLIYQANLTYMYSQQLQRQVLIFTNLVVGAPQKSDSSKQELDYLQILKGNLAPSKF